MGKMKPLPPVLNGVRIIKDLGVNYLNERSRTKTRNAVIECPVCKEQRTVNIYAIRNGQSQGMCPSCSNSGERNGGYRHGESCTSTHRNTRTHHIWTTMKQRCLNPNCKDYPRYGGRGIRVCKEWMTYEGFKEWARDKLVGEMTIERVDPNGDYCPENCVVVPHWAQAYNRRNGIKGGLPKYVAIARELEDTPPYHGKGKAIAKKYGVPEYVVVKIKHPTTRRKLVELDIESPQWYQELKERYEHLDA